jgi:hypothetical protein
MSKGTFYCNCHSLREDRMNWYYQGYMWTIGSGQTSADIPLDPTKNYLVTGGLTQTDSGPAHVYISTLCTISGDQQSCGVRDDGGDDRLGLEEPLPLGSSKVTITFKSGGGGFHVAYFVVYEV